VVPGKNHDKKLYDQSKTHKPPDVELIGDTGYLGTILTIPHKKPRKRELSKKQKKYNRKLSSERVCVEHAIGKMKIWLIAKNQIRNSKSSHSLQIKNIAGLQNLMFA
jgi:IS5 family transposase